jgi:Protein of unknown function, DUF481
MGMCFTSEDRLLHRYLFLLAVLLLPGNCFARIGEIAIKLKHKTDIVLMDNGDRNTGEIKKMEFGVLYLKSDRVADTLKLDWERVVHVQSIARYEFETQDKEFYVGTIAQDPDQEVPPGELNILLDDGSEIQLIIRDVISVREMGRSFLSRLNLSLDAGASFTSANKRTQTNINASISSRRPKFSRSLSLSSQFSGEPDTTKTARHEVRARAQRFLKKNWESVFLAAFLHDNQQNLQLRSTAGGGILRTFYESNRTFFYSIAGAVYTNENYFDVEQSDRNNAEALAALGFSTYRFRGSHLNTVVFVFPSLSDPGRIRIDTSFDWKWDMVHDLYLKISLMNNYDNRPPQGGINNNLSVTTTVGWSF